jgi:hypothetical protein
MVTYDGWTFDEAGNMFGPQGQAFDVYGDQLNTGGSSFDWDGLSSGIGDLLGYAGKTAVDTWRQKTLQEQSIDGQRYIEGQRMQQQLLQHQLQTGGIPPVLIIGGLAVVAFLLVKS